MSEEKRKPKKVAEASTAYDPKVDASASEMEDEAQAAATLSQLREQALADHAAGKTRKLP